MAKIVQFPAQEDNLVKQLEMLLERAKEGRFKRFVFAAETTIKEQEDDDRTLVATSWYDADVGDQQYLVAHLEANITMAIVEANIDDI